MFNSIKQMFNNTNSAAKSVGTGIVKLVKWIADALQAMLQLIIDAIKLTLHNTNMILLVSVIIGTFSTAYTVHTAWLIIGSLFNLFLFQTAWVFVIMFVSMLGANVTLISLQKMLLHSINKAIEVQVA